MKYITKTRNETFVIKKYVNGKSYSFGNYPTLKEAQYFRDYFENKGWENCLNERLSHGNTLWENKNLKNINRTSSGKYTVKKYIDGKTYSFGSYETLDEAIHFRDYFENKGWKNCLNERFLYSTSNFIQEVDGKFKVEKSFGNHTKGERKRYSYGTFNTLEEAIAHRDKCLFNEWDESLRPQPNPTMCIRRNGDKYFIAHKINGKSYTWGTFNTLEEALHERDLLIKYDWDYDTLCEGIDDTIDGEIRFLTGKTVKTTFQKYDARNDIVMWVNSAKYKPRVKRGNRECKKII